MHILAVGVPTSFSHSGSLLQALKNLVIHSLSEALLLRGFAPLVQKKYSNAAATIIAITIAIIVGASKPFINYLLWLIYKYFYKKKNGYIIERGGNKMDNRKVLIFLLIVFIASALFFKVYIFPSLACSLSQEKVDTRAEMPQYSCKNDFDCQLFDLSNQKNVYFWNYSNIAQIGVEVDTSLTKENVYRRVCENGVCAHKAIDKYYLPFQFKRKSDGSLEIPSYMSEGSTCVAFNKGECSYGVSGKIKYIRNSTGSVIDIKCVTCNLINHTVNGSIEINEIDSSLFVRNYSVEACDLACGSDVDCDGYSPDSFVIRKIGENYYTIGYCNATCNFMPLKIESFKVIAMDPCVGNVELAPSVPYILTDDVKLSLQVKTNLENMRIPFGAKVIIEINRSVDGKEEEIKRCEYEEIKRYDYSDKCEVTIDASKGSYYAMMSFIFGNTVFKQEKTFPIYISDVRKCGNGNCGEGVTIKYRESIQVNKKCACGHWSCYNEKTSNICCKNEDCGDTNQYECRNCVCVYKETEGQKLFKTCINITKITANEIHENFISENPGYPIAINVSALRISLKGSFYNDINQSTFDENRCGECKITATYSPVVYENITKLLKPGTEINFVIDYSAGGINIWP